MKFLGEQKFLLLPSSLITDIILGAILTIYLQLSGIQACLRPKPGPTNACSCPDGFKKASNKTGNTFDDNLCLFDNDSLLTYSEAKVTINTSIMV